MTSAEQLHLPVLLDRTLELLLPALDVPGAIFVDATLGMGGHSEQVLLRNDHVRLIGVDRDPQALRLAGQRLQRFGDRFIPVHSEYDEIPAALAGLGISQVHGVLFDLGVSSLQLDAVERGFSYAQDAPLDMRMNRESDEPTAAEILRTYTAAQLRQIFKEFGEEKFAHSIAAEIVRRREAGENMATSKQLVECVEDVIPYHLRRSGHPAKRIFQALRIEVNQEIKILQRALPRAIETLAIDGRMVVLSYHSLEDRITKQVLRRGAESSAPAGLVIEPEEYKPYLKLLSKAEPATDQEIAANPRSKSVRLRSAQRIRLTPAHMKVQVEQ